MDRRSLRENRRHGSPDFPVGIYRMECKAGESILDTHWHSETEFLAVEQGKATFQIGLSTFEVREGEIVYIPGGELHGGYSSDGSACTYSAIVFDLEWLMGGQDQIAAQFFKPLQHGDILLSLFGSRDTSWGGAAYERLKELAALPDANDLVAQLKIKGGLMFLFAEFAGSRVHARQDSANRTPERLKKVLSHMEEHCARRLTIGELASIAAMSEGHFCRVFKTFLRRTPIDYLNRLRLRDAAEKLRLPGVSVAEAAMECGFDNFSYFSKMFRAVYGCTPSDYRKNG